MPTTTAPTLPTGATARSQHVGLAILALAVGGFAIGTTEFVTMGLLPEIATGMHVSIPTAGHVISSYAAGVVVGAPVLAYLGARFPRRALLIGLMVAFLLGNAASALAPTYATLVVARFASGLPHGAFFGVAALVAADLVEPHRRGRAVSLTMLGLSVANVVGVPAATWLGQHVGWRSAYWLVASIALLTVALVRLFAPLTPGDAQATGRRELALFARPQVWLTLVAGAIGFGGLFAVFSYIAPTVTVVGGLPQSAVPVFLLALGLGMVVGTGLAGRLADWSVLRSMLIGSLGMAATLALLWVVAPAGWWALPVAFLLTTLGSVYVVALQLRLMAVAGDSQTLGAASNHASLNIANALGAWLGGLVIAAGHGYRAPALVGVGLALVGAAVVVLSAWLHLGLMPRERTATGQHE